MGYTIENGEYKKQQMKDGAWKHITTTQYNPGKNALALLTGQKSGITAIDLDNPNNIHNKILLQLMTNCNFIVKTKKGFHYIFKYTDKIETDINEIAKIDIRNDKAILYASPTRLLVDDTVVCSYDIIKCPDGNELQELSNEAIEYILSLKELKNKKQKNTSDEPRPEPRPEQRPETVSTLEDDDIAFILSQLSPSRSDNYDDWLKIGMILKNENYPVSLWDTFSQKSNKYCGSFEIQQKWDSFNSTGLKIGTLFKMLKEDNYPVFLKYKEKTGTEILENPTHYNIAVNVLPNIIDKYAYDGRWYALNEWNTWDVFNEKGYPKSFIEEVIKIALDKLRKCEPQKGNGENYKEYEAKYKEYLRIQKIVQNKSCYSPVCELLQNMMYEKIPKDIEAHKFYFRDCYVDLIGNDGIKYYTPQDYVLSHNTTGYNAPYNNTNTKKLYELFDGIFEDEGMVNYMLNIFAKCLSGDNREEELYVWIGKGGRNGKGSISKLLKLAFGNLMKEVDINTFVKEQSSSGSANANLVGMMNKRIVMTTEPEADDKLLVGQLKKLRGKDGIECRGLYERETTVYYPQFRLFIQANADVKLSKVDKAIQKTLKTVKFEIDFVDNPLLSNERMINYDLKTQMETNHEQYRDAFISELMRRWFSMNETRNVIVVPDKIKQSTEDYCNSNNIIKEWFDTHYEITGNNDDVIKACELKQKYLETNKNMRDNEFYHYVDCMRIEKRSRDRYKYYHGIREKTKITSASASASAF